MPRTWKRNTVAPIRPAHPTRQQLSLLTGGLLAALLGVPAARAAMNGSGAPAQQQAASQDETAPTGADGTDAAGTPPSPLVGEIEPWQTDASAVDDQDMGLGYGLASPPSSTPATTSLPDPVPPDLGPLPFDNPGSVNGDRPARPAAPLGEQSIDPTFGTADAAADASADDNGSGSGSGSGGSGSGSGGSGSGSGTGTGAGSGS